MTKDFQIIELDGFPKPIIICGVGHTDELIETLLCKKPCDKRSKEYKIWKVQINKVIQISNQLAGFPRWSTQK